MKEVKSGEERKREREREKRSEIRDIKIIFAKRSEVNGTPAENWSHPENRDASIS